MMPTCDFTYSHYEEILDLVHKTDYKAVFFNEAYHHDKEIIIRHDIDLDLEQAYKMALVENKHNIRTTYFIWMRSPFYNILDRAGSEFIKGILDLGHQIGLHFDEAYYGLNDTADIIKKVDAEVQLLKDYFNTPICAVSFHRPSQLILQSDIKLNHNLINTYNSDFTQGFKYISDSRGMWKEGCLCSFLEEKAGKDSKNLRIQALVHPIWWTDEKLSVQDKMERILLKKLKVMDHELEKNIQIYRKLFV